MNTSALTSLLWFVGIGALFYFMMRAGGCGAHGHGGHGDHRHGGHDGHDAHPTEPASSTASRSSTTREGSDAPPVDPVCGMPVAHPSPALKRNHMGRTFTFCSQDCVRKFDADPSSYARAEATSAPHHRAHGC